MCFVFTSLICRVYIYQALFLSYILHVLLIILCLLQFWSMNLFMYWIYHFPMLFLTFFLLFIVVDGEVVDLLLMHIVVFWGIYCSPFWITFQSSVSASVPLIVQLCSCFWVLSKLLSSQFLFVLLCILLSLLSFERIYVVRPLTYLDVLLLRLKIHIP